MSKLRVISILTIFLISLLADSLPMQAFQSDPEAQCNEGFQLFQEGKITEALPKLEAGFAERESATFTDPNDEGSCALALGILRNNIGNRSGGLDAYQVALDIFQANGNRQLEGMALNLIGQADFDQGKYEQTLESYQKALEISRELGDRDGEGSTLNNIGMVYGAKGQYELALEQYNMALEINREMSDYAGEAVTLNNIATLYQNQGKYDQALTIFQQVLEIMLQMENRAGEGKALNNIGSVYDAKGQYELALEHYNQALEIKNEVNDRAGQGATLSNLGTVYEDQGQYNQALVYYEQALEIHREIGGPVGESTALNNIGGIYENQGKYNEALELYEQALDITRQIGDRGNEARALNNIGLIYDNQAQYDQALAYYEQALDIFREIKNLTGEGITLNNIAAVYHHQGKYDNALELYKEFIENNEIQDRAQEGITLNNIGELYRTLGSYDEALEYMQQALQISREIGSPADEGLALSNMAIVYENQGKHDQALTTLQKALEITREIGTRAEEGTILNNMGVIYSNQEQYELALEQYSLALVIREEVGDRVGQAITLDNIGFAYEQQGLAEEALDHYEQAIGIFEAVRVSAGDDEQRTSFIAQHADTYQRATNLYHQQGQDEEAFETSEEGRARSFLDSLATGEVRLSDEELQALIVQEREAYDQRRTVQNALARARGQNDTELVADLEAQLELLEEEYNEAQAAIEAQGEGLADMVPGRSGVSTLAELQALLDGETTLLSYWVLGEEDGTLAFVITDDEFTVTRLPDATPINLEKKLLDPANDGTSLPKWLKSNADNPHPKSLRDLYGWVVAPLTEHLKTPKVGIIPHQELHEVPFAALTDGERYFGEQYTLFRLPSASALSHIEKNATTLALATQPALIFGNPITEDFPPLVNAQKEAVSVAELLGGAVYVETEANEARLSSEAVGAPVVHLAAHSSYNPDNALYSAIHLAPQGDDDGRLETHEVYGLDLSATEMVVLSACQTNVGDASAGDDIVGLTRAFFFAGTPTLVSSLWNVDDAATEKLMSAFYRNWKAGMGKAEALQAAQAELRRTYPSPFYWAAFVVNGYPDNPPNPIWRLMRQVGLGIAGLLAVVVLLVFGINLNKRRRSQ